MNVGVSKLTDFDLWVTDICGFEKCIELGT